MSSSVTNTQEIVQVLCRQGLTFAGLLASLRTRFPSSGWAGAAGSTTLSSLLDAGRITGLFFQSTTPTGWQINTRALQVNPVANAQYGPFCNFFQTQCC